MSTVSELKGKRAVGAIVKLYQKAALKTIWRSALVAKFVINKLSSIIVKGKGRDRDEQKGE